MKARNKFTAAAATIGLLAGGCSSSYGEEIGCGKYLEQGDTTVKSLGRALLRCWQELPDELKTPAGAGYVLAGEIPTQEGNMHFSVSSEVPLGEGTDKFARNTRNVFLTTFPNGSEDAGNTVAVDQDPANGDLFTHWIENVPPKPYKKVLASENPLFVEAIGVEVPDPNDPEAVKCIQEDTIQQFAGALGSASGASGLPEFTIPPTVAPCNLG